MFQEINKLAGSSLNYQRSHLRLPGRGQAALSWIRPVCFVMIGFVMLMYREAQPLNRVMSLLR